MRKLLPLLLFLAWIGPLRADFETGVAAYRAGDYAAALREFRALADKGVVIAYTNLGYMYALGEGVDADMRRAAEWFRRAAEAGDAAAQLTLGVLYYNGEGVERDLARAYAWFNIAATNGRGDALEYMSITMRRMTEAESAAAQRLSRELFERYGDPRARGLLESPATADRRRARDRPAAPRAERGL